MRDPSLTQVFDLYLGAPSLTVLRDALSQLGEPASESTYRLRHAQAIARLGSSAAVVSIPLRTSDEDLATLLIEIVGVARAWGLTRSDRPGADLEVSELTMEFRTRRGEAAALPRTSGAGVSIEGPWWRPSMRGWAIGAVAALAFLLMYALLAGGFVMAIASGMH